MLYFKLRMLKRGGRGGTSGSATRRSAASGSMMGSAGSTAGPGGVSAATATAVSNAAPASPAAPVTAPTPAPAAPVGPATNTTVTSNAVANFAKLSDSAMAAEINKAVGVGLPNQLNDRPDATQNLVFSAGMNEKPMVLDQAGFNAFMKKNGLKQKDLLSRDIRPITYTNASNTAVKMTADDVADMMLYSRFNYIGGKHGGQAYGAGTYFDHTNGKSTGYGRGVAGSKTVVAVLNPATTRAISYSNLRSKIASFSSSHPKTSAAIKKIHSRVGGSSESLWALAMGYNVIESGSGYVNVIDRSALVYRV